MRIFISTGEASGDAYGAALIERLKKAGDFRIEGSGGSKMRSAGIELVADSSRWGAMSVVQAVRVLPRVFFGYRKVKAKLSSGEPGCFIPIDFGYANIRLARHAKSQGWKVLYFVPPGSWRRDRQGRDLPEITDAIVTPFSWSADILNEMGANARWFGHPIKELISQVEVVEQPRDRIAILPGSRDHEIEANLPLIAKAVQGLDKLEFGLAPSTDSQRVRALWQSLTNRSGDEFTAGDTYAVLSRARAAIVCSGTATLEAALCRCPMVVVYRLTRMMMLEVKLIGFKRPKFIALPNILLDRQAVPELVQDEATPEALRQNLDQLLVDSPERRSQLAEFEELDRILGPADAITQTAEWIRSLAGYSPIQ